MEESTFGYRLKTILSKKGITRKQLALDAQISEQAVGNYINGKRKPDYDVVSKIAKALNVSADYLIGLSGIPTRNETIQGIHEETGLWEDAITKLIVEKSVDDNEVSEFISYLITREQLPKLIKAIKQKNEVSDNTICRLDINGEDHEANMKAVFKLIVNDLFLEIIDGYTVEPGQTMICHREGCNNG